MVHGPKQRPKGAGWRRRSNKRRAEKAYAIERHERELMSKTHSNELTAAGKQMAKWLTQVLGRPGDPITTLQLVNEIHTRYPAPKWSSEDQVGIGRVAMAVLQKQNRELWEKLKQQDPAVQDRDFGGGS